jgi:lysophospholipase L1-like esterase
MNYNELNALIDAYINRNGVQAITGQILNGVLKVMVEQLGRGYAIMGVAVPTDDPGTPDAPEAYVASAVGTYTNFDGIEVEAGELALLCYQPDLGWSKKDLYEGFQQVLATVDNATGTPAVSVDYQNGVLSFDFRNLKGNTGDAAGFGTVAASVDDQVGTPAVSVSSSGPDTEKNFTFAFRNLKGETGVTSVVATVDNTTGTPQCAVSLNGQQLTLAFTGLKGAQGDTGVSADYPITIVNNLTTNDPTSALSAAQGVVLQGEVSQLEAEVTESDYDVNGKKKLPIIQGWINGSGNWNNLNTNFQFVAIKVEHGQSVKMKGGSATVAVAFLTSYPSPVNGSAAPLSSSAGYTARIDSNNTAQSFTVPSDVIYLAVYTTISGNATTYEYITIDGRNIDKSILEIIGDLESDMNSKVEFLTEQKADAIPVNLFDKADAVDGTLTRNTLFAVQPSDTDFVSGWIAVKPSTKYYFSHILQRINETAATDNDDSDALTQSYGYVGTHEYTSSATGKFVRFAANKNFIDDLYMVESNDAVVYPPRVKVSDLALSKEGATQSEIFNNRGTKNIYNKANNLFQTTYDVANQQFKFANGYRTSEKIRVVEGRKYCYYSQIEIVCLDANDAVVNVDRVGSQNIIRIRPGGEHIVLFGTDANMENAYLIESETDEGYSAFASKYVISPERIDIDFLRESINPSWNSRWFFGKKCVIDGDSISHDQGGENYWQYINRNNLGMNLVASTFTGSDSNTYTIGTRGIGGSRIAYGAEQNPIEYCIGSRYQYLSDDADVIIIAGGTNDWAHGGVELGTMADRTNVTFYGAMHLLCVGLINKYPDKLIVFNTPIKRMNLDDVNTNGNTLKQFVDAILEVCGYYGIPACDLFRRCTMNPSIQAQQELYFLLNDDTHPNATGQKLIGDCVSAFLLSIR